MSNILKGIINETSPHNYDSDWDYQNAVARSGKSRSSYPSAEDDTFDADVAYSRKMYQLGQQQKAAKEKAQRDSDHDRIASGTNEDITEASNSYEPVMIQGYDNWLKLVSIPNVDRHAYKSDITAVTSLGDVIGEFNTDKDLGYVIKKYAKGVSEGLDDPWGDQGNFAGDKPVNLGGVSMKNIQTGDTVTYLGQPSKVVAMSKDRKYSRITISKGMGGVTQDVLTSDLQQLGRGTAIEEDDKTQTRMRMNDYYDLADAIQEKLKTTIKLGDKERIQQLYKERDDLDARVKKYGLMPESEQLDEISNEKLSQYKTAAALDAGKADKEGDYKRGDKRFSGIVKATKKQFANDTKKSGISQGINEFAPIKPPTAGAFGGNKDYGQPTSSRYLGNNKFVVGTTNNYVLTATVDKWGLEWDEDDEIWFLDSPGAVYIADATEGEIELPAPQEQRNQIHDLVSDYLNARNSAELQKVAAYYGHSDDGEMATNEAVSEAPRFSSKQEVINHFVKNGKSAAAGAAAWERGYRGSSKKPIELKKPPQRSYHDELDDKRYSTFENLGDQLKSQSLEALQQIKQQIEQKRAEDLAQWEQDFRNNVASKMRNQPILPPEATPVSQPGEKHSVLKARLSQLNSAIQKQELLDKLIDRLERKGLMTPSMQNDTDTRMHVKYGAKDNYQSLNQKLDNAIATLQNRLDIRKKSGLKEVHDERDEYDNPRMGKDYGKGNLFVDPGSTEFPKEKHPSDPEVERGRPKNLKGISKSLPADAFGRTTGKIPASARPTSKEDPFKEVDEADMNRRGFLGKAGAGALAAAGLGGASNAQAFKGTLPAPSISEDEAEAQIKQLRSTAYKELASMMWNAWPKILDTTFGANTPVDKPATPDEIGKMLGYRIAEYAEEYRQKVRAIKIAAGVKDPQSLNKTTAAIYVNEQEIDEEQLDELKCWSGYTRVQGVPAGAPGSCKKKTNEEQHSEGCPHCGGEMVSEELMNEKKDACYYKVKSRYKVWPSAYASGALVKCRNKGAKNWGTGGKKNESIEEDQLDEKWTKKYKDSINCSNPKGFSQKAHCDGKQKNESSILEGINRVDENLHDWFNKEKWVRMDTKGKIKGPCAKEPGEGKPKCLPQAKAHSLGKKGRASAAARKRREDPNPERSGKAINVNTKKKD